jgi:hypothetical protein
MKPKFNKLMIVPFGNYDSPLKTFITKLDEQMNTILEKKIPVDEKIKLYNNVLVKYKNNFDSDVVTGTNNIRMEQLETALTDQIKNLDVKLENIDTEIKKENQELKEELQERDYQNTEELNSNLNNVKKELKKNILISNLNKTNLNKSILNKAKKKSVKEKKPPEPMEIKISQKTKRKNNNNLTLIDNRPRKKKDEEAGGQKSKIRQEKKFIKAKRVKPLEINLPRNKDYNPPDSNHEVLNDITLQSEDEYSETETDDDDSNNQLNRQILKTPPVVTRGQSNEYNEAKKKAEQQGTGFGEKFKWVKKKYF